MTSPFHYEGDALFCGEVQVRSIAERAGTPCYIYSADAILEAYRTYDEGLAGVPHRVCYAMKANSTQAVLALLARNGAGFDIVSGGELFRALRAGADPQGIVFSGVGKTAEEIDYALERSIHAFNCESEAELALLDALAARRGIVARAAVRVNPDVDAETHPYICTGLRENKFGVDIAEVEGVYTRARGLRNVALEGVACHIGSQISSSAPVLEALDRMLALTDRLRTCGFAIRHLDLGGGLGVSYREGDAAPDIGATVAEVCTRVREHGLTLFVEPGRSLVAEAGILVTRVLYRKANGPREFMVVDAAMNDLIRPALYQAHHEIVPVRKNDRGTVVADVVGPICESGDFLARARKMPEALPGDLLAVRTAGAYGFVQASNYNSRPRPAEVLVEGREWRVVRVRETYEDLVRGESV